MEETKQQPLGLRVCAELAGSFLLCFAIYAFSTWGSAVYGVNVVFMAVATGLAYAVVTAIFSRISGGQFNPAVTVAAVLASKTKLVDGILYVIAQVIGAFDRLALPRCQRIREGLRVLLAAHPVWHHVLHHLGDCRRSRCLADCGGCRHVHHGQER